MPYRGTPACDRQTFRQQAAIGNLLITVWELCLRDGDAEASRGELPQEVNYGSRARSCYK